MWRSLFISCFRMLFSSSSSEMRFSCSKLISSTRPVTRIELPRIIAAIAVASTLKTIHFTLLTGSWDTGTTD
uniref:Putative secreted protein n=1 Tax=Anopheles marajoara TaxID=58244 RepID=A0A2M4CE60_9DIPT